MIFDFYDAPQSYDVHQSIKEKIVQECRPYFETSNVQFGVIELGMHSHPYYKGYIRNCDTTVFIFHLHCYTESFSLSAIVHNNGLYGLIERNCKDLESVIKNIYALSRGVWSKDIRRLHWRT